MNKLRDDQEFNINFVKIVQKYRCLYDKTTPEYRTKDDHDRVWQMVAQEANEGVSHCKERWRNLRACLTRHLKNRQRQSNGHKPYYLADHMHFLLPFTRTRSPKSHSAVGVQLKTEYTDYMLNMVKQQSTSENDDDDNNDVDHQDCEANGTDDRHDDEATSGSVTYVDDEDDEQDIATTPMLLEKRGSATETVSTYNHLTHYPSTTTTTTAATTTSGPTVSVTGTDLILKIANESPSRRSLSGVQPMQTGAIDGSYQPEAKRFASEAAIVMPVNAKEIEDADVNFFKSLLPDIRQMNASQKRRFKIGILGLIDDICERH